MSNKYAKHLNYLNILKSKKEVRFKKIPNFPCGKWQIDTNLYHKGGVR